MRQLIVAFIALGLWSVANIACVDDVAAPEPILEPASNNPHLISTPPACVARENHICTTFFGGICMECVARKSKARPDSLGPPDGGGWESWNPMPFSWQTDWNRK